MEIPRVIAIEYYPRIQPIDKIRKNKNRESSKYQKKNDSKYIKNYEEKPKCDSNKGGNIDIYA